MKSSRASSRGGARSSRVAPRTSPIEITRECPLRCPGLLCLRRRSSRRRRHPAPGQRLQGRRARHRVHAAHRRARSDPPLDRRRRAAGPLPRAGRPAAEARRARHLHAARDQRRPPDSRRWASIPRLQIVVSIDGLQPEHDERRKPATYARILQHIKGQHITVHCTVTRQQVQRDGYLEEFVDFWSRNEDVDQFWVSLYTPQIGESSPEILLPADRARSSPTCCGCARSIRS